MKRFIKWALALTVLIALVFPMCKTSDLRTPGLKKQGITPENAARGKAILQEALKAMNYAAWAKYPTYKIIGSDTWHKQMGMNLNPWPGENGATLRLRYATNTFDSEIKWLDGSLKDQAYGLQSWQLYRRAPSKPAEKVKIDKKMGFILPTMQYFNELLYRLSNVPIVAYAGSDDTYDIVFCAWESAEPNQHDQYLLYINRATHRLEKTSYTIRDNYMWTPKNFYGTAVYSDFRVVDSITVPFKMEVYPFHEIGKKKVHEYKIKSWSFNAFPIDSLYPFPDLQKMGDVK